MDEIYVTYVDDEHVDNHDYDDTTDDDHDNNNGSTLVSIYNLNSRARGIGGRSTRRF